MSIKNLRLNTRMPQKAFAEYFNIPVRTLQDWEGGRRIPPKYVIELIKYKLKKERVGMLKLVEKDHSEETILKEGTFEQILKYLKENENLINWVHDEDDTIVLPKLNEVEDVEDLKRELEKIDLSWWSLEIEEI